eukprot:scaffold78429_cov50-Prasinocladus_malaysianus.AAC.1
MPRARSSLRGLLDGGMTLRSRSALVPKPKWKNRCPPEGCYQMNAATAFDTYMVGIIICCIAAGIDFPHLGSKVCPSHSSLPVFA